MLTSLIITSTTLLLSLSILTSTMRFTLLILASSFLFSRLILLSSLLPFLLILSSIFPSLQHSLCSSLPSWLAFIVTKQRSELQLPLLWLKIQLLSLCKLLVLLGTPQVSLRP